MSPSPSDDLLSEKRKLSEPSVDQHPQRLSRGSSNTRASFANLGKAQTSPFAFANHFEQNKPPTTPSTSSHSQSHEAPFLQPRPHHAASPSSSISSFHKAASSTNLAVESSPASSRSAQGTSEKPPVSRSSRSKLNLLNPVSLLKRRRTSQVVESNNETPIIPTKTMDVPVMRLPANYDPRIKGKGVHDFDGGPRPKRNWSANDMPGMATQAGQGMDDARRSSSIPVLSGKANDDDPNSSQEKEHAPVFVENFEDDESSASQGVSAVQRESLANSNFLARMSKQINLEALDFTTPAAKQPDPPATPSTPHQASPVPPTQNARNSRNTDNSSLRISSDQSTARSSESNDTKATSPPQSPQMVPGARQPRTLDPPFQPSQQLSHLPSTASHNSRFSFQLNSDHCIEQEKALEDRHKQKQAARHSQHLSTADSRFEDFDEEEMNYDDMMDDMGYEEDIPTVNAEEEIASAGLGDKRLSSFRDHPRDEEKSKFSDTTRTSLNSHCTESVGERTSNDQDESAVGSLGLMHVPTGSQALGIQLQAEEEPSRFGDMYFSDGLIDESIIDAVNSTDSNFDESLLDSPVQSHAPNPNDDFPTPTRHSGKQRQPVEPLNEHSSEVVNTTLYHDDPFGISEEKTPTKPAVNRPALQLTEPVPENNLNAYHSALAEAASKAARDGKFSRQNSVMTASSIYSSNPSIPELGSTDQSGNMDDITGACQPLEDVDEDDDLMVAAANAEALASEDDYFYAQEFGFFRNPNTTGDGELYNGGYFGQTNFLGASLRNREPNLTPITERSEYSTRNSVVGSTPWGPPSAGPWGPPSSTSHTNVMSPGLKDLAARMGMDDEDMTLGQLLRLRREAFGAGSAPQSAHPSSSSNESSPISQQNPSSLAGRASSGAGMGGSFVSTEHQRRPSEPELPQVQELPENHESGEEDERQESPISDNVALGTARAVLYNTRGQRRRSSAELLAREYSTLINDSPVPIIAEPIKPTPPSSPTQPATAFSSPATVAGASSPPMLVSPRPQRASVGPMVKTPAPKTSSPLSSPPIGHNELRESSKVPTPPTALLHKFASQPAPDAYRKSWDPSSLHQHRRRGSGESDSEATSSVAYVREVDEDGVEQWFVEKRRKKSSGELVVIGREAMQSGRI